mmetsp:Transcript_18879/g.47902  ORF Transcript_18879/g.47902 Transcript_18879/m.47902 type:complete len:250 (+) Transcript_18879:361-1110(+)
MGCKCSTQHSTGYHLQLPMTGGCIGTMAYRWLSEPNQHSTGLEAPLGQAEAAAAARAQCSSGPEVPCGSSWPAPYQGAPRPRPGGQPASTEASGHHALRSISISLSSTKVSNPLTPTHYRRVNAHTRGWALQHRSCWITKGPRAYVRCSVKAVSKTLRHGVVLSCSSCIHQSAPHRVPEHHILPGLQQVAELLLADWCKHLSLQRVADSPHGLHQGLQVIFRSGVKLVRLGGQQLQHTVACVLDGATKR